MALEGLHHITAIAADATRNGVLLELATRDTGFTVDEPLESRGEELKLPPQHESDRARLEGLTPLANPRSGTAGRS
jgi:glyoxalase family protein